LRSWLALCRIQGLDDATICHLVQHFGSPEAVWEGSTQGLMAVGKLSTSQVQAIQRGPEARSLKEIDQDIKTLDRLGASVLTYLDPDYPARLRTIPDPPPLLYVNGNPEGLDQYAVGIVGSRRPTPAGRLVTEELSRDLAALGFTVVSGLARGIDGAAHRGALAAEGRTVAVLGCGIDRTYPSEHQELRAEIEAHGAVLSELPLGAYPHGYHFPRRNRIISGLSLGVVVSEAALQSGSLITARLAAEQGREVFAVPGFIKAETSRGPNGLIKQGAKLVEGAWDVVEELLPQLDAGFRDRLKRLSTVQPSPALTESEALVGNLLSAQPTHIDELILRSGLTAADVAGLLLGMELRRVIQQLPGNFYIRV
jgi:DNA processing protein